MDKSPLEVSRVEHQDLLQIANLAHEIWPIAYCNILSKDQIQYMLARMYSLATLESNAILGHEFYTFQLHGNRIGFTSLQPNFPRSGFLRLHKIYLLEAFQGKGHGKEMMEHVYQCAYQHNLFKISLNVNKANPALKFYQSLGFEIVAEEKIDIGNGYFMDDYMMETKLVIPKGK